MQKLELIEYNLLYIYERRYFAIVILNVASLRTYLLSVKFYYIYTIIQFIYFIKMNSMLCLFSSHIVYI